MGFSPFKTSNLSLKKLLKLRPYFMGYIGTYSLILLWCSSRVCHVKHFDCRDFLKIFTYKGLGLTCVWLFRDEKYFSRLMYSIVAHLSAFQIKEFTRGDSKQQNNIFTTSESYKMYTVELWRDILKFRKILYISELTQIRPCPLRLKTWCITCLLNYLLIILFVCRY